MKKVKILVSAIMIILISVICSNMTYAATTMDLNITETRPYTNLKYTVTIGGSGTQKDATIFKVIRKNAGTVVTDDSFALYCLRSGLGFGSLELTGLNNLSDVQYTQYGDLNQEADKILDYYKNTIGYTNIDTYNSYNAILWIIDNMYLPENSDMDKNKFLAKAGLENSTLTEDEIEVIQQMALWYFANYDQNGDEYSLSLPDDTHLSAILKKDAVSYNEVAKIEEIDALYTYFITNAKANAANYGIGNIRDITLTQKRIEIDKTNPITITQDSDANYVIGPINIKKSTEIDDYEVTVKITDGNGNVIPEKTEADIPIMYINNFPVNLSELPGKGEIYLTIPSIFVAEYDLSDITIETTTTYFETTSSLWIADEEEQPILKVEKEKVEEKDTATTETLSGEFKLKINKVDESNNTLLGAAFEIINESAGRTQLIVNDNGNGTFETRDIEIEIVNEEFIFSIEEITAPSGYIGINGPFKIKVTTKLSEDGTEYIVESVKFIDSLGEEITSIAGVEISFTNNLITIKVENIKTRELDLALRKYITKINGVDLDTDRTPTIDTSKLNTIDSTTNKRVTTATYTHSKEPVIVKQGDIVTYKIRVYNEGELDAYATEIADYIPEGLGYLLDYKGNTDNYWHPVTDSTNETVNLVGENGLYASESAVNNLSIDDFYTSTTLNTLSDVKVLKGKAKIYSTALENEKIKAYNEETTSADIQSDETWQQSINGTDGLYYKEIEVTCIVLEENSYEGILRNIAEIQNYQAMDENDEAINAGDRDSVSNNVDIDNYNPPSDNSSYQQDDDDYEPLVLKHFDLALRKFITAVNNEEVTTRIPEVKVNEEGKLEYEHDKNPVYVTNSDFVTYTIRVYNEGTVLGYATEIADDIPDGLVFLPNNEINKQYGWEMYDAQGVKTDDIRKAVGIRTRYLENEILEPYNSLQEISEENPAYAEVKVVFQVVEKNIVTSDRIVINKAHITEDKAVDNSGNELDLEDEDSIPDEWNEGEDDQDIEKIYVQKFDLSLLKWVTQTIVTVDGKTTVTQTGFTPYDSPEPIAQVVIDKNKINKTTVKFVYNIIIKNEGEIAGYATEITDYIPEGLEFVAEDNPIWTKVGDNKITTRALEGTLLEPGETATLEVVFTWKNSSENLGIKTNIAEISEDYNEKGSEDIDSVPDNVITENYDNQQEDDDDKALVMLTIKTGGKNSYTWLMLVVLAIIAGGIILIKKFILV